MEAPELAEPKPAKPLWRRVFDFPLVALLVAVVLLVVSLGALSLLFQWLPLEGAPDWLGNPLVAVVSTLLVVVIYKLVVARLGESPRDDLPFDTRAKDGWRGAVVAAILMSVIVGLIAVLGGYRIAGWGGSTSLPMLLFAAGIHAAFVEEILLRGVIFRFLEEFGGSWFALALSSLLFGFAHASNPNATLFSSIAIAIEAGILLGGAYMFTRNLWLAVGLHFGWNVTQGYLWDVPVSGLAVDGLVDAHSAGSPLISGGEFGAEASLVALVVATAFGVWLVVRAAQRGNLVRPWWVRRRLARQADA